MTFRFLAPAQEELFEAVIYQEGAGGILVVAVAHQRRQPAYWERRL